MSTRTCSPRRRTRNRELAAALAALFLLIIPLILGGFVLAEKEVAKTPDITTEAVVKAGYRTALQQVTERYTLTIKAEELGAEAAELTPTGSLTTDQLCYVLGIDEDKTEVLDSGVLESTLKTASGNEVRMTIKDNIVRLDGNAIKLKPNGGINKIWGGYNSQHDTDVVIGNQKRSLEELATIRSIADSVYAVNGAFTHANISGNAHGFWWTVLIAYIIVAFIVAAIVVLARLAFRSR